MTRQAGAFDQSIRLLSCGPSAILLDFGDRRTRRRLVTALSPCPWEDVQDIVPADVTILVRAQPGARLDDLARRILHLAQQVRDHPDISPTAANSGREHIVPVAYGGPDLTLVAEHLQVTEHEVIARHTEQVWTVEFAGFTPGFAYLTRPEGALRVPRRAVPRTMVPAGSVAVADDYSGIYPADSPGGWQIIGHTDVRPWDLHRREPALFGPGDTVRFVGVER